MSFSVTIDTKDFDKALLNYSVASKKTFAESLNRQTKNLAIQGMKVVKVAEKSAIKTLESKDFWRRVVYAVFNSKQGYPGDKTFTGIVKPITHPKLLKLSKSLIRSRLKAVGFCKFFFSKLADEAGKHVPGGISRKGNKFKGFSVNLKPATEQNPRNEWIVYYDYKKRSGKTAKKTNRILQGALQFAFTNTVADMEKYISRKMAEHAKKWSAI